MRTPRHRVDEFTSTHLSMTNLAVIQRETIAPASRTEPLLAHAVVTSKGWSMIPDKRNTVLMTAGTLHLTLYSLRQRTQKTLVLTPDDVYLDGQMHYGSAAMVEWSPGVFYKMSADVDGCSFLTFVHQEESANEAVESLVA